MSVPKRVLQLDQPIETVEVGDGRWVARLAILGIEEFGDSHDAAQDAAVQSLLARLAEMSDEGAGAWIEANSTRMPEGYVPECSVESPDAEPLAEVMP